MIETKESRKRFEEETGRTLGPERKKVAQSHFETEAHPPKRSGKFLVSTRHNEPGRWAQVAMDFLEKGDLLNARISLRACIDSCAARRRKKAEAMRRWRKGK